MVDQKKWGMELYVQRNSKRFASSFRVNCFFFTSLVLAACGGSGDGGGVPATYSIAASVSGLFAGPNLVLQDNGADNLTFTVDGTTRFNASLASGSAYAITVLTQPAGQTCTVASGAGKVTNSDVTIVVTCTANSYTVGGSVSGLLPGNSVILEDNGAANLNVSANGSFTFAVSVPSQSAYAVTVGGQPVGQSCPVSNGSGKIAAAKVTNIVVTCSGLPFKIGVTVSGRANVTGLLLQDNGGDNLSLMASGTFDFATPIANGSAYAVTVVTQPAGPPCFVTNGSGTVADAGVNVAVTCPWHMAYLAYPGNITVAYIDQSTGAMFGPNSSFGASIPNLASVAAGPGGKFLYAGTSGDVAGDSILAFVINPQSGALISVSGSPYATGAGVNSIAVNPSSGFVYAANSAAGTISAFSINSSTGGLVRVVGSPFSDMVPTDIITIDPAGRFVYGINFGTENGTNGIAGYSISASTGALTPISSSATTAGSAPTNVVVDSSGKFVYASNEYAPVSGFSINAVTGALAPIAANGILDHANWIVTSPNAPFAYVSADNGIDGYSIDPITGALTPVTGSAFSDSGPSATYEIDPSGLFLFGGGGDLWNINPTTGALSPGGCLAMLYVCLVQPGYTRFSIVTLGGE